MVSDNNKATWTELTIPVWPSVRWTFVSSGNIDLTAYAGKEIYIAFKYTSTNTSGASCDTWEIKNFYISAEMPSVTNVSLNGFPLSVSDLSYLSYCIESDLLPNTTYYYTVTPAGGSKSNEISVITTDPELSGLSVCSQVPAYTLTGDKLYVTDSQESVLTLYNVAGQILDRQQNIPSASFELPAKGLYLLQIIKNSKSIIHKIVY